MAGILLLATTINRVIAVPFVVVFILNDRVVAVPFVQCRYLWLSVVWKSGNNQVGVSMCSD